MISLQYHRTRRCIMLRETVRPTLSGLAVLPFLIAIAVLTTRAVVFAAIAQEVWPVLGWLAVLLVTIVLFFGLFVVQPNQGVVLQLFGSYRGTAREAGLRFANPFYSKRRLS